MQWIANQAIGATLPNLNTGIIRSIKITYPPLPIQRKIAAILSAYDDLIENNTRRIAILEEMARAIYQEWFVRFRFPGHERVRMVPSPLGGEMPEGWEVVKLGDIASDVRKSVNPASIDPETPYVGLEHIPRGSIALTDWGQSQEVESTKLWFNQGDILFGKIRPYFHKVVVAPISGVCSSDTIVIVPRSNHCFGLTLACVSSVDFVNFATQTSQGTKMPRANWDIMKGYALLLPPIDLLERFDEIIRCFVMQIQNFIMRNRHLRHTRDLLLPKLVAGEIDVSGMDVATGEVG